MNDVDPHGIGQRFGRRVFLGFICLLIAPIAGLWVAFKFPNPPGTGPGGWQVIFGIGVPAALALGASRVAEVRRRESILWVVMALAATLGLLVLIGLFVASLD
jgi:hypothetical protein